MKIAIRRTKSKHEKPQVIGICTEAPKQKEEEGCGCPAPPERTYKTHITNVKFGVPDLGCPSCGCKTCECNRIPINRKQCGEYYENGNTTYQTNCPCESCS